MKKRIISAIVFVLLWVAILVINNRWFDTLAVIAISTIATFEYLRAFKGIGYKPISWIAYLGCLSILFTGGLIPEEYRIMLIKILFPLALIGSFAYIMLSNVKRTMKDIAITILGVLYIPFTLAFIKLSITIW